FDSTDVPFDSTDVPFDSTDVPFDSTDVPFDSTDVPVPTDAPASTDSASTDSAGLSGGLSDAASDTSDTSVAADVSDAAADDEGASGTGGTRAESVPAPGEPDWLPAGLMERVGTAGREESADGAGGSGAPGPAGRSGSSGRSDRAGQESFSGRSEPLGPSGPGAGMEARGGAVDGGTDQEAVLAERARQAAYERSLAALLPASPDEVERYRRSLDQRERAMSDPAPGAMRSRTERVRLEPGFKAPVIELTPNLVTALVFTDSTGKPWPVSASVLGSGTLFAAQTLEGGSANQIVVSPLTNHGESNLVVTLEGRDVPVLARLTTSSAVDRGRELDGLVVFQVQERGPLAAAPSSAGAGEGEGSFSAADDLLYALLDGLIPEGASTLAAEPALEGESFCQAGGDIYLRTRRSLFWPPFKQKASGAGGLTVYAFPPVPSVLLADGEETQTVVLTGVVSGGRVLEAR
ncbi:MAG: DotH/IcmK family type IV secretion protein, partial [Deltaproteobacteria bacterium]|nr:DotH/IcmK family type IV secretion protein [Deltaproteobacteria bacterium]